MEWRVFVEERNGLFRCSCLRVSRDQIAPGFAFDGGDMFGECTGGGAFEILEGSQKRLECLFVLVKVVPAPCEFVVGKCCVAIGGECEDLLVVY